MALELVPPCCGRSLHEVRGWWVRLLAGGGTSGLLDGPGYLLVNSGIKGGTDG